MLDLIHWSERVWFDEMFVMSSFGSMIEIWMFVFFKVVRICGFVS